MAKTTKAFLPVLVIFAALALTITGCAPAASLPGATSAGQAPRAASPSHKAAPPVEKLDGVPTECLTLDEMLAAARTQFDGVYPSAIDGALVCEYSVTSLGQVISMNYEPFQEGSAADWKTQALAARPGATVVAGTGNAAIYFEDAKYHEFDFISGSTVCNITASTNFTRKQLVEVAYFALTQNS